MSAHWSFARVRRAAATLGVALVAVALLTVACGGDDGPKTLTIVAHDSFDANESLIEAFEAEFDATVVIISGGDANQVVNRAILNAGNPEADLLFGVDNLSFRRAIDADVFEPFEAARRSDIPEEIRAAFDDDDRVTPIDYGFVTLNFDPAAGDPPTTFEQLTDPQWSGKLVVEDPATSSPGLQFLASTVAYFGEGGWQQFWRDLRANDVLVVDGWSEAYFTHFSFYGGDRPLVVSYTSSPAAEAFFAELDAPPTLNVIPGPLFRQVEAAAVLRGADNRQLAEDFIDFMLRDEFQQQIPETMFVYPVIAGLDVPDWWRWAQVEVDVASIDTDADEIQRWIREWEEIMRR